MEVLIYFVFLGIVAVVLNGAKRGKKSGQSSASVPNRPKAGSAASVFARSAGKTGPRTRPLADDGHYIKAEDDISCRRFGHRHAEDAVPRFIPHNDPEEGYIILNGKKMLRTEADRYENTI